MPYRLRDHLSAFAALGFLLSPSAFSAAPKIDLIELFQNNGVLIHFDTEANRTYQLQYTETLTNGVPGGTWTNLFVAPNIPFPSHYVVLDTPLRPQRFYRLRVLP
ncbi:MAG TPA: hypothetical protein VFZ59_00790 [Verrucomicrobiae bacterium]|nr:hypothetical protein [Verrucomicrobiae bacterium]